MEEGASPSNPYTGLGHLANCFYILSMCMDTIKIAIPAQTITAAAKVEKTTKTTKKAAAATKATTEKKVVKRMPNHPTDTEKAPFLVDINGQFAECELYHYYGKSMDPVVKNGDILIVREEMFFGAFQPGAMYLMHRREGGHWLPFVGYLKPSSTYFELLPENNKFQPALIERRDTGFCYRVIGKLSFNI